MEKKKMPRWQKKMLIVLGACIALLVLFIAVIPKTDDTTTVKPKSWEKMSYEEHQKWIEEKVDNNMPNGFYASMMGGIRHKFNFPEEVKFVDIPHGSLANITLADTGLVFFSGQVLAKNAFGVKSRYAYSVKTFIRPDTVYISNIEVSPR